jgi:Cysteine-rich CWC
MKHEQKNCPRCENVFECKVGDVANCQCSQFKLDAGEIAFIEELYDDCLCISCIHELRRRYIHFVNKYMIMHN